VHEQKKHVKNCPASRREEKNMLKIAMQRAGVKKTCSKLYCIMQVAKKHVESSRACCRDEINLLKFVMRLAGECFVA
jgi:hypothetical protein